MRNVALGKTGVTISCMGLGCSKFGSAINGVGGAAAEKLINAAIESGINFFDTANIYGQGESERLLSKALKPRRHEVVIATKAGQVFSSAAKTLSFIKKPISLLAMQFPSIAKEIKRRRDQPLPRCFDPDYLKSELDRSLARLQTDYVDIFYLHSPRLEHLKNIDIEQLMSTLKNAGKIRSWGISCDAEDDVESILSLSSPDVLQLPYDRTLEHPVLTQCEKMRSRGGAIIVRGIISQFHEKLHKEHDALSQLRSSWGTVLAAPHVTAALCGTTNVAHLLENVTAIEQQADRRSASRI